uniref:Uncharacterized protein n=1 Tax=Cucumis melo TaxID=3656 RepID=A0A9I9EDS5_CUCME
VYPTSIRHSPTVDNASGDVDFRNRCLSAQTTSGTIPYSRFPAKFNCSTLFRQPNERGNGPRRTSVRDVKAFTMPPGIGPLNLLLAKVRELGNVRGDGARKIVGIGMKNSNVWKLIEEAIEGWCAELKAIEVDGCNCGCRLVVRWVVTIKPFGTPLKASVRPAVITAFSRTSGTTYFEILRFAVGTVGYGVDYQRTKQVEEQKQPNSSSHLFPHWIPLSSDDKYDCVIGYSWASALVEQELNGLDTHLKSAPFSLLY